MISFTVNDARMATIASEILEDHCEDARRDYSRDDRESAKKLGKLRQGLLVTGIEQSAAEAAELLKAVVQAELDHWVPDASQRLINRAATVLADGPILDPVLAPDHGNNPGDHALIQDWVCGIFVLRCCTCARLFKV